MGWREIFLNVSMVCPMTDTLPGKEMNSIKIFVKIPFTIKFELRSVYQ